MYEGMCVCIYVFALVYGIFVYGSESDHTHIPYIIYYIIFKSIFITLVLFKQKHISIKLIYLHLLSLMSR